MKGLYLSLIGLCFIGEVIFFVNMLNTDDPVFSIVPAVCGLIVGYFFFDIWCSDD